MKNKSVIRMFLHGMLVLFIVQGFVKPTQLNAATSVWVATDGNDASGDGSVSRPFATIGYALTRVAAGDTLQIKGGTYNESLSIANKEDFIFRGADAADTVYVVGIQSGPVISYDPGVQNGTRAMRFENLVISHADTSLSGSGMEILGGTPVISGVVFRNNKAGGGRGAGLSLLNATSTRPLIEYCTFNDNYASRGAALYTEGPVELRYNRFFRNKAASGSGGAVYFNKASALRVYNNRFFENAADSGGAVYVSAKSTLNLTQNFFSANFFTGNSAAMAGGAFYQTGTDVISSVVENNTFAENQSDQSGGALYIKAVSGILLRENVIVVNKALGDGGAIYLKNITSATVSLWSNSVSGNQSQGQGGAIYVDNVSQLSIGDAFSQRNNFFYNRNASQINNITSKSSIANLSLAHNYWGTNDQSSIISTLDIPQINTSWSTYDNTPADTRIKLVGVLPKIWFADGSLDYSLAGTGVGLTPMADSMVIVRTMPDTMLSLDGADVSLPKNYKFNWQSTILPQAAGKLTFLLDSSELNYLGNPLPNTIKAYYEAGGSWQTMPTATENGGRRIQVDYADPSRLSFGIGVKASGLDSVLYVLPRPYRTDVDAAGDISIVFQKDMNPATLNNNTIFIYGAASGRHAARFAYDAAERRLLIEMDKPFMAGEEVTVVLSDRIEQSNGERFVGYSWQYTVSALRGSASLIPRTVNQTGVYGSKFRFADFDGDNLPELVRMDASSVAVLQRDAAGVYQLSDQVSIAGYDLLRIVDVNGDGTPEVVVIGSSMIEIFPYNASSGFGSSSQLDVNTGSYLVDARILDLNSDGILDFALLRDYVSNFSVDIYPGQINGNNYTLGSPLTNFLGGSPSRLGVLDSDADGLPDLLVNEVSGVSAVSVLVNKNGSFSRNELAVNTFGNQQDLLAANVWQQARENDEKREILVAGATTGLPDRVDIYSMTSATELSLNDSLSFSAMIYAVAAADINSDGFPDIVTLTADSTLHIRYSESGVPVSRTSVKLDFGAQYLRAVDFDNDGDRDILVFGYDETDTRWQLWENDTRKPRSWWVDAASYNSANDGDREQPFNTIRQAIAHSFEGDTVFVNGAQPYRENLTVNHSLTMNSWDSARVVLLPDTDDLFARNLLTVSGAAEFHLSNWALDNDRAAAEWTGLALNRVDSVNVVGLSVTGFKQGLVLSGSGGLMQNILAEDNELGLNGDSLNLTIKYLSLKNNLNGGAIIKQSTMRIDTADINNNNSSDADGRGGLEISQNSDVTLNYANLDANNGANIILNNASLTTRLVYMGKARAGDYGLLAYNNARLTLDNSVVADNAQTGLQLSNSSGEIVNSLFIGNDSLGQNGGSAVVINNGSDFLIHNSIFINNNTAVNRVNGTTRIRYNNFWANQADLNGATPGAGNRQTDPLFVFSYNPLGIRQGVNGFENLKLAAGSPLIDAGDPTLKNEGTDSRSDIGLYGNLGAPYMIAEYPQTRVTVLDSSIELAWDAPETAAARSLWGGMAVFRSTGENFTPDTLNLVAAVGRDTLSFEDRSMVFGTDYFYKLAYLDTNGAAIGYAPSINGRIDFGAFALFRDTVNVQMGQGDSLVRPLRVKNTGTLPVSVVVSRPSVTWLTLSPDTLNIEVGATEQLTMRLNATGLARDSLYSTRFNLHMAGNAGSEKTVLLNLMVSYRDLLRPATAIIGSYPDTIRQTGVTIRFTGDDTSNSTIGTPRKLLRYEYRLRRFNSTYQVSDTALGESVSFYPLEEGLYRFEVAAVDTAFNGGLDKNSVSLDFVVRAPKFVIRKKRWQFVSLPFELSAMPDLDLSSIRAIKYWNRDGYVDADPDSLVPGRSYWMVSEKFMALKTADAAPVSSDSARVISLNRGWNMIGAPWNWDISIDDLRIRAADGLYSFDQAVSDSLINGTLLFYDNSAPGIEPYLPMKGKGLRKHSGYWLYAYQPGDLYIEPRPYLEDENGSLEKAARWLAADDDAIFKLQAQRGDERVENYYSVLTQKEKYPYIYRGAIEPPAISRRIRMFARRNNLAHLSDFTTGIPGDSAKQWQIIVEIPEGKESTRLSWERFSRGDDIHYFLYHLEKGEWFDVSERSEYDLGEARGKQHFRLYASRNSDFSPRVLPIRFELGQNYPNPFNPETTIRIRVPFFANDKKARLAVYDVLGRKVVELFNKKVKSGEIKVKWDGRNSFGGQVASGIYFYRFEADKFVSSKKMILIR